MTDEDLVGEMATVVGLVLDRDLGNGTDRPAVIREALNAILRGFARSGRPLTAVLAAAELTASAVLVGAAASGLSPEDLWAQAVVRARQQAARRDR